MDEENMMDDEHTQNRRSESAFSGTSDDARSDTDKNTNLPLEIYCKAYLVKATDRVRFDLWKPSLEKRSGVKFEDGRMYIVRGKIDGTARFESRHVASGSPHVYVFAEAGARVAPGQTCRLLVEALEEKRKFAVVMGRRGPVVRVSGPTLMGLGVPPEEGCVAELKLVRPPDQTVRRVFARWDPLLGFMMLELGGAGFAVGDTVEIVGGRRYGVGPFVEDFRAHRLRELSNFELGLEGGSLIPAVDGRRVPVEQYWLTTHGLKAALKMKLGYDHREMKFVFDGSSVEARFGNSDPILEYSAAGSGLDVKYSRTAGQAYVMRLEQEPLQELVQGLDWLVGGVRVIERPDIPQGMYLLEMSDEVQETVRRKLNETVDRATYKKLRGDIGEGILNLVRQDMRMQLLYDHPWSELGAGYGSRRPGPDFMVRCLDSGLAAYVEVKWHESVVRAFGEARDQVLEYFQLKPNWKGMKIAGAYIAVIDWKITKTAKLWVERVA